MHSVNRNVLLSLNAVYLMLYDTLLLDALALFLLNIVVSHLSLPKFVFVLNLK